MQALDDLAKTALHHLAEISTLGRKTSEHTWLAREALAKAKKHLPRGTSWEGWLRQHDIPKTTAFEAVKVYNEFADAAAASKHTISEAKRIAGCSGYKKRHVPSVKDVKEVDDDDSFDGAPDVKIVFIDGIPQVKEVEEVEQLGEKESQAKDGRAEGEAHPEPATIPIGSTISIKDLANHRSTESQWAVAAESTLIVLLESWCAELEYLLKKPPTLSSKQQATLSGIVRHFHTVLSEVEETLCTSRTMNTTNTTSPSEEELNDQVGSSPMQEAR